MSHYKLDTNYTYPATLLCDFYKVSHREQYPSSTEKIYSTFTPRKSRIKGVNEAVAFGFQYFAKEYLIDYFNKHFFERDIAWVVHEYKRFIRHTLGVEDPDTSHIEALHKLGYLPVRLRAVKEGTQVPVKVPVATMENTKPEFFWLTNYLETLMSSELWQPMTTATTAKKYRKILDKYALKTAGNTDMVPFQLHDFSMRGMAGLYGGANSSAGHLLSFVGTDSIPSIMFFEKYYDANIERELVGTSISATEHSTMSANANPDTRDEYESFKRLLTEVYPSGMFSVVSDTYDFWHVIGDILPSLKKEIMERDGKMVIRPDSGDPVKVICGNYIPELTEPNYPDITPDYAVDYFADEIYDMDLCGDGYFGDDSYTFKFKMNDKYYSIKLDVEYNRHDKRYYYIENIKNAGVEEYHPSLEDLGLVESLWNIFGGTLNAKGYKELDSHVGAIYGDSITPERAEEICKQLKAKGFASTNVVLGVGGYSYQMVTRDTLGFAMKATYAVVNGEEKLIYKDPKTDNGMKKSQRGRVAVGHDLNGDIIYKDGLTQQEEDELPGMNMLEDVFVDGELVREQTLADIRERLL